MGFFSKGRKTSEGRHDPSCTCRGCNTTRKLSEQPTTRRVNKFVKDMPMSEKEQRQLQRHRRTMSGPKKSWWY